MAFPPLATPFYSTVTTIPSPSPNPYTSYASFPNPYGYGYSGYYNTYPQPPVENTNYWSNTSYPSFSSHPCTSSAPSPLPYSQPQPPPPYSPSPPYCHPPPYQPIDVIQRSFGEILQTSQRSFNEFTQICQKFQNDSRDSHELIKASQNSIKESFEAFCKELQEHFQGVKEDQEELVEKDYEEKPEETEMFLVHGTSPKMVVQLAQMGTETITSQKSQGNLKNTIADDKFTNEAPNLPTPKPSESRKFKRRNGSMTKHKLSFIPPELAAIPQLKPPDVSITPTPPPEPPDRVSALPLAPPPPPKPPVSRLLTRPPTPSSPPPKPPDPTPDTNPTPMPPPKLPDRVSVQPPTPPPPSRPPNFGFLSLAVDSQASCEPSMPSPPSDCIPLKEPISNKLQPSDIFVFSVAKSQPLIERTSHVKQLQPTPEQHVSRPPSRVLPRRPTSPNLHPATSTPRIFVLERPITAQHHMPVSVSKMLSLVFHKWPHRTLPPSDLLCFPKAVSHPFTTNTIPVPAQEATTLRHVSPYVLPTPTKREHTPPDFQDIGRQLCTRAEIPIRLPMHVYLENPFAAINFLATTCMLRLIRMCKHHFVCS